ncbi:hypothetical protein ACFVGN_12835 [Streptomyces sp. NPDC057757]|uniref:hypothetical protein n=1 Tax=Streptomyces sp. NPDC057757 TaxID=3346241 RepID=UPI00369B61CE
MSTAHPTASDGTYSQAAPAQRTRDVGTETKPSFKTSEFAAFVVVTVGILIASMAVGAEEGHADYFRADRAWLYIVILTAGYMISRGLAKSGTRAHHDDH